MSENNKNANRICQCCGMPLDDGTFRILSNEVEEKELKLPRVAYSE
ncbi:MAG: hypothetical protein IJL63_05495 [Clostridia bacterium]|nr:hypothetical protein [Clostridia bacterium]